MNSKPKLAILASHPIQYQAPLFRRLDAEVDLLVYFAWDFGVKKTKDPEFGKEIKWDTPLLEGYRYKFLRNLSFKPGPNFFGEINPGIIKEFWGNSYDAVLVLGWNTMSAWFAFLTAILSGKKIMLRGENPLNQELLKSRLNRFLKRIVLGTLFKFIGAFLYIGEENRKFYEYYGVPDKKLFFVPYAVDNEWFMNVAEKLRLKKKELRREEGIPEEAAVILFVGKLIPKKRPLDLLKTLKNLPKNAFLVLVGDGVLREEIKEFAIKYDLKNVLITGFKNQSEVPRYYAMADIFALPSGPGETWGLTVNEAMCFGLPVLVSNMVGSAADLVQSGRNGYIIPAGNTSELGERSTELLQNPELLERFGRGSLVVIEKYSYAEDVRGILMALKQTR